MGLRIRDAGVCVTPDGLDKSFTSFYTTKENGTGPEPALVQKIVESHGGRIDKASASGTGTTGLI